MLEGERVRFNLEGVEIDALRLRTCAGAVATSNGALDDARLRELETLAGSRKAGLAAILEDLPRIRLKEICRELGLDDSGREKAVLVARLTEDSPLAPSMTPSIRGGSRHSRSRAA